MPSERTGFIIERLACFDGPSAVAAEVKKEFGITVSVQNVQAHDPEKSTGQHLAPKWREHFYRIRKAFREDVEDVPVANKAFRLRLLDQMARQFKEMGNLYGAMEALEQAAREMGGSYDRRGVAVNLKAEEPYKPKSPGADVCAEIGRRFTVVKGGKD